MEVLYTDGSAYSGQILGYLIISFIAISGSYIYGTLLTANGSLMKMNGIFIISVLLNIGLNYWLIPSYQALGAAIATCFTQFLVFFAQVFLAKAELQLRHAPFMIIRIILFLAGITLVSYSLYHFWSALWFVKFLVGISAGISLAFLFRLIDVRQLRLLLAQRK
jgi:O-antigen/teichoic acid export membrane protein